MEIKKSLQNLRHNVYLHVGRKVQTSVNNRKRKVPGDGDRAGSAKRIEYEDVGCLHKKNREKQTNQSRITAYISHTPPNRINGFERPHAAAACKIS